MTSKEFNTLDDSLSSFELIKKLSEKYWEDVELNLCWGFQIQQNSKWKKGLSEAELNDFQGEMGFEFSESLKNFYRTMNGLDKQGINNNGGEGEVNYRSVFYSYPNDLNLIKSHINWALEDNQVSQKDIDSKKVPPIFPYFGHRFLILDKPDVVLSMYGTDIIYWDENLSKAVARDIFGFYDICANTEKLDNTGFWNIKTQ